MPSRLRRILRLPCTDQASQHAQLYSPDPAASENFTFFSSRQVFCLILLFSSVKLSLRGVYFSLVLVFFLFFRVTSLRHYTQLIHLRAMIKDMEKNEGLHTLSQTERDILYAATDVAGEDGEFVAHDLARHTLARDISHATYHRAFKSLLGKGFMKPARGFKTRNYVLQEVRAQG